MSSRWLQERRRDYHYRLAKEKGYRSRAAFKLLQANERFHFVKPGFTVVDLGCAPGGWLQVASELVGPEGVVLGVDKIPVQPLPSHSVSIIQVDITSADAAEAIGRQLQKPADVVLSDVSPNISGVWEVDHERQIHLAECSLDIGCHVLKAGGSMFVKVFDGPSLHSFAAELKQRFADVRIVKPPASKSKSSELYFLARGFRRRRSE